MTRRVPESVKRTAIPTGLACLALAIALGALPRLATTLQIFGRPDEALRTLPFPVGGLVIGLLIASVLLVAIRRGWVPARRATATEIVGLVTILLAPVLALWVVSGPWFFDELWWLAAPVPFLTLHVVGRLDAFVALVAAVTLAAMASIPSATTFTGTDKLHVVMLAMHSGWPLRAVGVLAGLVLASLAARRGSGAVRGVAVSVALWLTAGVVRDGATLHLGGVLDQGVDVAGLLWCERVAQWADWALMPVVAIGVATLTIGWLGRERVAAPAIVFVAALFAVGPIHDPWLVDEGPIEPWYLGGLDAPVTLTAGWQLSDVHADEYAIDAEGQRQLIDEPVNELNRRHPVVALLHASPDATMADLTAAGFASDVYHRVFLVGPEHDPRMLRPATRRWPAAGALLRHHRFAVELHSTGTLSCPWEHGVWLSEPPEPGTTVDQFLGAAPCIAAAEPPARPLPDDWRTVEPEWLLRAPSLPSGWLSSLLWGLALAGLIIAAWIARGLRSLRDATPEDRSPHPDDRVWPPWVPAEDATHRWARKRGGSPYRDAEEGRFAGPATADAAVRALRARLRVGLWRALLTLWTVGLALVFAGLVWAAAGQ